MMFYEVDELGWCRKKLEERGRALVVVVEEKDDEISESTRRSFIKANPNPTRETSTRHFARTSRAENASRSHVSLTDQR